MLRSLSKKSGQTILEYAVLIGVIVAGLIAMQVYLKRGYQGKIRESADSMGQQFSPGHTTTHARSESRTESTENLANEVTVTDIANQYSNRTSSENVEQFNNEQWW